MPLNLIFSETCSQLAADLAYRKKKESAGLRKLNFRVPTNRYNALMCLLSDHSILSQVLEFYHKVQPNPQFVKGGDTTLLS